MTDEYYGVKALPELYRQWANTGMVANIGTRIVEVAHGSLVLEGNMTGEAHGFPTSRGTIIHGGAIATLAEDTVDPRDALETVMRRSAEAVEGDVGFQLAMMGSNQLEWEGIEEQKAVLAAVVTRIIRRAVEAGAVRADFTFEDFGMVMCGITSTMYYKPGSADWRRHLAIVVDGLRPPVPAVEPESAKPRDS